MVAPFLGCLFGGLLYDVFIYTGPESPINRFVCCALIIPRAVEPSKLMPSNSPFMGLPHIFLPHKGLQARWEEREDPEVPPTAEDTVANV